MVLCADAQFDREQTALKGFQPANKTSAAQANTLACCNCHAVGQFLHEFRSPEWAVFEQCTQGTNVLT